MHFDGARNRIPRRYVLNRINPLQYLADHEIKERFRLSRAAIYDLIDTIRGDLVTSYIRNRALPTETQVCIALRYLATGDMQRTIGDTVRVSQSQVSKIVRNVTRAIARHAPRYIYMAERDEQGRLMQNFFRNHQLPGIIGCVDGTHIRIQKPSRFEYAYVNRKNYHSINCQIIADSDYIIQNVDARYFLKLFVNFRISIYRLYT